MNRCIVCGHIASQPVFNPGPQPLSALALPRSQQEAIESIRRPMNFYSCGICGHIWNVEFKYADVPYAGDSNLMYNSGLLWHDHMQVLINCFLENKTSWINNSIVDIGCGDGLFFTQLLRTIPDAKCIGFEPGIEGDEVTEFECRRDYFVPERDLKELRPSVLVCRHVLEHLENPRDFIAEIAYWCSKYEISPVFLAETPCIENALDTGRLSDFLYEHVSNFTMTSMNALFNISGFQTINIQKHYGNEVVVGFFQSQSEYLRRLHRYPQDFKTKVSTTFDNVQAKICELKKYNDGTIIALWGGTGKGAAFINMFKLDCNEFPLVVDSDPQKYGRFVPGTGQEIQSAEILRGLNPIIIITTAWRAQDIFNEINSRQIPYQKILVLKDGDLNEYTSI
jgi:hypothetical protein